MHKFRKDDQIIVISGSNKGKTGKILSITNKGAIIDGINMAKVSKKPTHSEPGKFVSIPKPIALSKISHVENGKPVKVSFIVRDLAKKPFFSKERVSKKTKKEISN